MNKYFKPLVALIVGCVLFCSSQKTTSYAYFSDSKQIQSNLTITLSNQTENALFKFTGESQLKTDNDIPQNNNFYQYKTTFTLEREVTLLNNNVDAKGIIVNVRNRLSMDNNTTYYTDWQKYFTVTINGGNNIKLDNSDKKISFPITISFNDKAIKKFKYPEPEKLYFRLRITLPSGDFTTKDFTLDFNQVPNEKKSVTTLATASINQAQATLVPIEQSQVAASKPATYTAGDTPTTPPSDAELNTTKESEPANMAPTNTKESVGSSKKLTPSVIQNLQIATIQNHAVTKQVGRFLFPSESPNQALEQALQATEFEWLEQHLVLAKTITYLPNKGYEVQLEMTPQILPNSLTSVSNTIVSKEPLESLDNQQFSAPAIVIEHEQLSTDYQKGADNYSLKSDQTITLTKEPLILSFVSLNDQTHLLEQTDLTSLLANTHWQVINNENHAITLNTSNQTLTLTLAPDLPVTNASLQLVDNQSQSVLFERALSQVVTNTPLPSEVTTPEKNTTNQNQSIEQPTPSTTLPTEGVN